MHKPFLFNAVYFFSISYVYFSCKTFHHLGGWKISDFLQNLKNCTFFQTFEKNEIAKKYFGLSLFSTRSFTIVRNGEVPKFCELRKHVQDLNTPLKMQIQCFLNKVESFQRVWSSR